METSVDGGDSADDDKLMISLDTGVETGVDGGDSADDDNLMISLDMGVDHDKLALIITPTIAEVCCTGRETEGRPINQSNSPITIITHNELFFQHWYFAEKASPQRYAAGRERDKSRRYST